MVALELGAKVLLGEYWTTRVTMMDQTRSFVWVPNVASSQLLLDAFGGGEIAELGFNLSRHVLCPIFYASTCCAGVGRRALWLLGALDVE